MWGAGVWKGWIDKGVLHGGGTWKGWIDKGATESPPEAGLVTAEPPHRLKSQTAVPASPVCLVLLMLCPKQ